MHAHRGHNSVRTVAQFRPPQCQESPWQRAEAGRLSLAADHGHNHAEQTRHNSLRSQGNASSVTRSFAPIRGIAAHACAAQMTLGFMELIPVG